MEQSGDIFEVGQSVICDQPNTKTRIEALSRREHNFLSFQDMIHLMEAPSG